MAPNTPEENSHWMQSHRKPPDSSASAPTTTFDYSGNCIPRVQLILLLSELSQECCSRSAPASAVSPHYWTFIMITCASLCPMNLFEKPSRSSSSLLFSISLASTSPLSPSLAWNGSCPYHLHLARVKGQFLSPQLLISGRLAWLATLLEEAFSLDFWCHLSLPSCSLLLLFRVPSLSFSSTNLKWGSWLMFCLWASCLHLHSHLLAGLSHCCGFILSCCLMNLQIFTLTDFLSLSEI